MAVLIADKTLEELRLLAFFLSRYAATMTAKTDAVLQHDSTTAWKQIALVLRDAANWPFRPA